ncbi:glycoside hydrolase family 76 protein [Prauserella cavernicola]|uniref:Fructose-bisphosphate aldolase n=1 Tax=Prauserella cavernicola TaxID=2800127 RepID=A0A934QS79_9PSEU|nr:glycoside hydrolase family 76 protein [Prauserella cavernicola]MBK1784744.1 fructose-bisphosphate aldolase [Prauserella cavernicola]
MPWSEAAAEAESAVCARHLTRLWGVPGTALACSGWPPTAEQRLHRHWNYWWQAQLLDCLVDAQRRDRSAGRATTIARLVRTIRLRNRGRWSNPYYDDMAWLALALQRLGERRPVEVLLGSVWQGWSPDAGGGIRWRRGDTFKNAPTNGPAAIAFARAGEQRRARELFSWLENHLVDAPTGLVNDGVRPETCEIVRHIYTYCQGVFLGAALELSEMDLAERTVRAVAAHLAPGGVLRGQGGGDGGLFAGILARYLAIAARRLPSGPAADAAAELVFASARACWHGAAPTRHGPLFSPEWTERAEPMGAARDLSVQLGAWLLLEAAATLEP